MAIVDIAIAGILVVSAFVGFFRGFVKESLSLISWLLAFWLAYVYTPQGLVYFESYIAQPALKYLAAFAAIFILSLVALSALSYILYRIFAIAGISGIDRSLGLVFGLVRGMAIIGILILGAIFMDFSTQPWWKESLLVAYFDPVTDFFRSFLPGEIAKHVSHV